MIINNTKPSQRGKRQSPFWYWSGEKDSEKLMGKALCGLETAARKRTDLSSLAKYFSFCIFLVWWWLLHSCYLVYSVKCRRHCSSIHLPSPSLCSESWHPGLTAAPLYLCQVTPALLVLTLSIKKKLLKILDVHKEMVIIQMEIPTQSNPFVKWQRKAIRSIWSKQNSQCKQEGGKASHWGHCSYSVLCLHS